MRVLRLIVLLLCAVSFAASARMPVSDSDTAVYFVNIYPGPAIYELEGHSAILVDIRGREPRVYNFGVFDFEAPNFVYRFVKGETDYRAVEWPWEPFLYSYLRQGRRVMAHELDLDADRKARLLDLLQENVLPQNAVYRYNYVKDNCATRPLAAVERAVAPDSIALAAAPFEAQSYKWPTFRNVMRSYHANYPWYQFGIDLALGSGIDYTINRRELAFAPAELDAMIAHAVVAGRPLVKRSIAVNDVPADNAIEGPTPWYLTPLFVCWLFFVVTLAFTIRDIRRRKVCRLFDALYFGLMGITGLLLTFLIFVSVHEATSPNWLYLWLNPLCLLVPSLIYLKKAKKVLICYQMVNFAVLFCMLAVWAWLPQSANGAFLPLVLADMLRSGSYIYIERK